MSVSHKAEVKDVVKVQKPRRYAALMHNDDFTTMEFVIEVLETIFAKSSGEAYTIMMNVHKKGIGVAGVYSVDIATSKAKKAMELARENNFPFKMTVKEVDE
ncbi:MAG: ATP-dependent Clp protease adaptor ClpS [Epulopiscium sp. Nele67-Bin001]|nr:MAG: ATP-dependent Clp protease adaptor ClpS [Epulopiscium sp. Nuni2H_MBin001]OON93438.1 MAG: ATP-dependent Clp protease adaptor ClpS [Epulopiscium sp. Nele67-Bin001]